MKKGMLFLVLALLTQVFSTSTVLGVNKKQKKKSMSLSELQKKVEKEKEEKEKQQQLEQTTQPKEEEKKEDDQPQQTTPPEEQKKKEDDQPQQTTPPEEQKKKEDDQPQQTTPPEEQKKKEDDQPQQTTPPKEEEKKEVEAQEWSDQEDVAQNDDEPTAYTVTQKTKSQIGGGMFALSVPKEETALINNYWREADYIVAHSDEISGRKDLQQLYKDAFTQAMNKILAQIKENREKGMKAEDYITVMGLLQQNKQLLKKLTAVKLIAKKKEIPTKEMNDLATEALKAHKEFREHAEEKATDFLEENGIDDDTTYETFGVNTPEGILVNLKRAKKEAYKGKLGKQNRQLVESMLYVLVSEVENGEIDTETISGYLALIQRKSIEVASEIVELLDKALVKAMQECNTEAHDFTADKSGLYKSIIKMREGLSTYADRFTNKKEIVSEDPKLKFLGGVQGLITAPEEDEKD